ncbi:FtsX-like permease family protein [Alkaliphilus transvaalensis]|uniref:FtsX-like permease family protein n=1 Tax=Alkaliphilus transvaalensis TaxID=114628 RepID=UPI00047A2B01|nr:ABC transporter permease [Alkaliphilus transvaalensis]
MNLLDLALRNIKNNIKKHIMFFFSMTFSVFTVYTFLALVQNQQVNDAFIYDGRYRAVLLAFGVIIMVFVMFFLISSNNSFIKARKREISTYSLFGMSHGRIGKLIFLETLLVGLTSLATGIGVGIFFSKLTTMILLSVTVISFSGDVALDIDLKAIYLTAIMFISVFSMMGLSGLWVINRFQLVDLFKAEKRSEGKGKGSYILLIISLILIGWGYYLASSNNPYNLVMMAIPILVLVISGTYIFFWGGLPKVLSILKRNKRKYYRGVNLIAITSFSHRMRSISSVMATIAVLSAVATTAIATGFTLYSNIENNGYDTIGYDLFFYAGEDDGILQEVEEIFSRHDVEITQQAQVPLYRTYPKLEAIEIEGVTFYNEEYYFRVYSQTAYNELVNMSKSKIAPLEIASGKAVWFIRADVPRVMEIMKEQTLDFTDLNIEVSDVLVNTFLHFGSIYSLVLNDEDFSHLLLENQIVKEDKVGRGAGEVNVFNFNNALQNAELNSDLNKVLYQNAGGYRTAYSHYSEARETFGLISFIGFFMSGVFILMTASLLYFKQIMAAEEERHHYKTLRKIGMDYITEKRAITRRLLPVFAIPLLIGILHSIFAMKTADTMVFSHLMPMGNSYRKVLFFSSMMYGAYGFVYSIFYFITKGQYRKIIR